VTTDPISRPSQSLRRTNRHSAAVCWDLLAPYWPVLERHGMTGESLNPFAALIRSPVLVVGAGQGLLLESLLRAGRQTVGVDSAPAMVAAAKRRRGLVLIHARGQTLPFSGRRFASVIVATGVMDLGDAGSPARILAEARRVLQPGGSLIAGFFSPGERVRRAANALGLMTGWCQHQHRLADIWAAGRNLGSRARLVARWTGCSGVIAVKRVLQWRPVLDAVHDDVQRLAAAIRRTGGDPRQVLNRVLDFRLTGSSAASAGRLLADNAVACRGMYRQPGISTLTLAGELDKRAPCRARKGAMQ